MKITTKELRGSHLARWISAGLVAFVASGCVTSSYGRYQSYGYEGVGKEAPKTADLAVEIDALAGDLSRKAGLRIPLGSARVLIDDPVPIRPKSARFRPAQYGQQERRAAQAAIRFELEMALGNRMNVVGALDLSSDVKEAAAPAAPPLSVRAERTRATHALIGTFVKDGDEIDLSVQLVELGSEWIVATARRKIVGFVPDAYDERYGAPVPVVAPQDDAASRTAEVEKVESIEGAVGDGEVVEEAGVAEGEVAPMEVVEPGIEGDAPIEFTEGPAAARLRALGKIGGGSNGEPDSGDGGVK